MENFTQDLLEFLIETALEKKRNVANEYDLGELYGYYYSISLIINQSKAFGFYEKLPLKVREFVPESLLEK